MAKAEDTRPDVTIKNISRALLLVEGKRFRPGDIDTVTAATYDKLSKKKGAGKLFGKATDRMIDEEPEAGLPPAEEMPPHKNPNDGGIVSDTGASAEPVDPSKLKSLADLTQKDALSLVNASTSKKDLDRWAKGEERPKISNAIEARLGILAAEPTPQP